MTHDPLDWNLMARYLAGECSADESEAVRRWAAADARHLAELELMRDAWEMTGGLATAETVDRMWNRLAAGMATQGLHRGSRGDRPLTLLAPRRRRRLPPLLAAAAVALTVGAALALRQLNPGGWGRAASVAQEFRTTRGERAVLTLRDGSHIVLGPESRLRAMVGETGRREITLEGEAVFTVVHDSARAFVVRAGPAIARDLGTKFLVRAYANEPTHVVVSEGVVSVDDLVGAAAPGAVLAAADLARIDSDGSIAVERGVDPARYIAWAEGRLVFRRTALREVAARLERWFDVDIVVEDTALLDAAVTASFTDASLDQALRTLGVSLDARVERRGRSAVLSPRR